MDKRLMIFADIVAGYCRAHKIKQSDFIKWLYKIDFKETHLDKLINDKSIDTDTFKSKILLLITRYPSEHIDDCVSYVKNATYKLIERLYAIDSVAQRNLTASMLMAMLDIAPIPCPTKRGLT